MKVDMSRCPSLIRPLAVILNPDHGARFLLTSSHSSQEEPDIRLSYSQTVWSPVHLNDVPDAQKHYRVVTIVTGPNQRNELLY